MYLARFAALQFKLYIVLFEVKLLIYKVTACVRHIRLTTCFLPSLVKFRVFLLWHRHDGKYYNHICIS